MKPIAKEFGNKSFQSATTILCIALLGPGSSLLLAQGTTPTTKQPSATATDTPAEAAPKISNDQLDSLVAPIALYPDPLLAQTFAAATYPLEIVQLQQWLGKNKNLKGKALGDAVEKQTWDPSVQAMASFPDVVKRLGDNIQWTTDLGNAFLAQQADVMDAVQRMRAKAQGAGNLKSSQQQKVETKTVESKSVIVIEQADPQVVYVPSYNPTVVYGAAPYPYPSIYYPPPGYYAAGAALAFGAGVAIGAAWNGGWGWNCGWGHNDVNVNINNKYVNNWNKTNVNQANFNKANINQANLNKANINNSTWQHNPQHRGGAPYSDRGTANKYANRNPSATRPNTGAGGERRPGTGDNRPGAGGGGERRPGESGNRPGAGGGGERRPNAGATRPGAGGGGERIGNREVAKSPSARSNNAFSSGGGMNRSSATASHNRGASSMGSRGGGHGGGGRR